MDANEIIKQVKYLAQYNKSRNAVFLIMEKVDSLLSMSKYDDCKMLLNKMANEIEFYDTRIIHAILAITLVAKPSLEPQRTELYDAAIKSFSIKLAKTDIDRLFGQLK